MVLATCARERARGAGVQDTIDALLALSIQAGPLPVSMGAATPIGDAALAAASESSPTRERETPLLAQLPDELLALLFGQQHLVGCTTIGTLGQVCRDCHALTSRWLGTEVRTLRFTGKLRRWSDARILGLCRAARALQALQIDGCEVAVADGGFAAYAALLRLPTARRLHSLTLRDAQAFSDTHAALLATACPQLTAIALVACTRLTDRGALELCNLPRLRDLSLARNPSLSARASQQIARCLASRLVKLDMAYTGEGVFGGDDPASAMRPSGRAPGRARSVGSGGRDGGGRSISSPQSTAAAARPPSDTHAAAVANAWSQAAKEGVLAGSYEGVLAGSYEEVPCSEEGSTWIDVDAQLEAAAMALIGWENVHQLTSLTDLQLTGWRSFRRLGLEGLNTPCLLVLSLPACDRLEALELCIPTLTKLNASGCARLGAVSLKCPELAHLNLAHCKAIDTLEAPLSARLSHCALFGCRALGAPRLEALLAVCGASLRSLDLNGTIATEALTEAHVRAKCPSLERLDVRGRVRKY